MAAGSSFVLKKILSNMHIINIIKKKTLRKIKRRGFNEEALCRSAATNAQFANVQVLFL